ncbi:MAG: redoxin domain-containing protein [Bdellovibrionales bacterium]|nr:redoxin domain-containing protein [Bdellovibrionales bacterium]
MLSLLFILNLSFAGSDILNTSFKAIDGKEKTLSSYFAKAYLVVNIATRCGYTGQLGGLEKLYQKYKEKGLVVIGFPSNDFGGQTPEVEGEVKKFCKLNYGVSFPLTSKYSVKGSKASPLFKKLISASSKEEIGWNFEKFLINSKGIVVKRYKSSHKPKSIGPDIDKLL